MKFVRTLYSRSISSSTSLILFVTAISLFNLREVAHGADGDASFVQLLRPARPTAQPITAPQAPGQPNTSLVKVDPSLRAFEPSRSPTTTNLTSGSLDQASFSARRLELLRQNIQTASPRPSRPQASPTLPVP